MKCEKIISVLIRIYMYTTIINILLMFQSIDDPVLKLGASSCLLALFLSSSGSVSSFIGVLLWLWSILFPILLLVFYIMAQKRIFIPFTVISTADTVVLLVWGMYCWLMGDTHFTEIWLVDTVVSILFSVTLIAIVCSERCQRLRAIAHGHSTRGQEDGSAVPADES